MKYDSDHVSRTVKLLVDTGTAPSFPEAQKQLESARLVIETGPDIADSPTLQAALLTAVNTGRRCFLGGVHVTENLDVNLLVPWNSCRTLQEAVIALQGIPTITGPPEAPRIVIGDSPAFQNGPFAVRATFNGWSGGVIPLENNRRLPESQECVPAGVLAGALGISEAFQFIRGGNSIAGYRDVGLSLWQPNPEVSWLDGQNDGPPIERLPDRLWIIGLGHLGQANLWTLGLLPYVDPGEVNLVLQDFDTLIPANDSTSPLTFKPLIGQMKTRAMARWCEARGFSTCIVERHFDGNFQIDANEPNVALCGVDNAQARFALEDVGFKRIIEAGLGRAKEYLAFRVHTFPATKSARDRWEARQAENTTNLSCLPAYRALEKEGLNQCGITLLADKTVGASFVGTAVSTIIIAELMKLVLGEPQHTLIDGTLRSLDNRQTVPNKNVDTFNPGATPAIPVIKRMIN